MAGILSRHACRLQGDDGGALHSATRDLVDEGKNRLPPWHARCSMAGMPDPASYGASSWDVHHAWHYSVRPLDRGEWAVVRGDGEVGGTFATWEAAVRFLRFDLETVVLTHAPVGHA
jgi:hypothetical protein